MRVRVSECRSLGLSEVGCRQLGTGNWELATGYNIPMELLLLVLVIVGFLAGVAFLRAGRGRWTPDDGRDWCGPPPRDPNAPRQPSLLARLRRRLRPG